MKQFWKKMIPSFHSSSSARSQGYVRYTPLGKAIWTPPTYQKLAEEGYQKNVIVYRCVNLIARGIASIPWLLYENDHEIDSHPLLDLFNRPNPFQGGSAFMEQVVGHLLLSGNAYIHGVFSGQEIKELYSLRPDRVSILSHDRGISGYQYTVGQIQQFFNADPDQGTVPLMHLKQFHPLNDWYGMSPLEAAARSIDQHNTVSEHNLALLQNGGRPSGALLFRPQGKGMGSMSSEQRDLLRQDLREIYEGSQNAGKILVLEGDFDWKEMGLSPKDLDFVQGKHLSAREIAQAFGVPPLLVGIPGDATFANYKEARYHLWEDTIVPLMEMMIAELNLWVCPFFGPSLKLGYDLDAIPALTLRREATWAKISQADFLTVNEKRQAVGYSPLPPPPSQPPSRRVSMSSSPFFSSLVSELEIKAEGQEGSFSGYASIFHSRDTQGDIILPGAFQTSLRQWKTQGKWPKLLWQHNPAQPIGVWTNLEEDAHGLFVKGELLLDLALGKEAYTLLKERALDGLSIGFKPIRTHRKPGQKSLYIDEVDLKEISLVTFAAQPRASVLSVKSSLPPPLTNNEPEAPPESYPSWRSHWAHLCEVMRQ